MLAETAIQVIESFPLSEKERNKMLSMLSKPEPVKQKRKPLISDAACKELIINMVQRKALRRSS